MHYYTFHIGDYHSHTSRLSLLEDLAYRRLLDLYYLQEGPFTGTVEDVAREIGMNDCLTDVEYVLNRYFTSEANNWINKRADGEIAKYWSKKKTASKAGKASAKARQAKASEQTLNDRSTDVQPTNNHKPITNNHSTPPNPPKGGRRATAFKPPDVSEVMAYCQERGNQVDPERFVDFYSAKGWMVGKNKMKDWKAAVRNWEKRDGKDRQQARPANTGRLSAVERVRAARERAEAEQQGQALAPVGRDDPGLR